MKINKIHIQIAKNHRKSMNVNANQQNSMKINEHQCNLIPNLEASEIPIIKTSNSESSAAEAVACKSAAVEILFRPCRRVECPLSSLPLPTSVIN